MGIKLTMEAKMGFKKATTSDSKPTYTPLGLVRIDTEKYDAETVEELRTLSQSFWLKGYLPKGAKRDLKTNDKIRIHFKTKGKDPDWVLGHIYFDAGEGLEDVGSVYATGKVPEELKADLRDSEIDITYTVNLSDDYDSFELNSKTRLLLNFHTFKDDEADVVGRVSFQTK